MSSGEWPEPMDWPEKKSPVSNGVTGCGRVMDGGMAISASASASPALLRAVVCALLPVGIVQGLAVLLLLLALLPPPLFLMPRRHRERKVGRRNCFPPPAAVLATLELHQELNDPLSRCGFIFVRDEINSLFFPPFVPVLDLDVFRPP